MRLARWSSKSPEPAPLTKEGEAFLRAVDGGHLNVVQSLADRHFIAAGEVDVPRTSAGRTALMSASFSGHLEAATAKWKRTTASPCYNGERPQAERSC